MDFDEFQERARCTDGAPYAGPDSLMIPILGLLGEAGTAAAIYKKYLRDGLSLEEQHASMKQELGDALWYIAAIATRCGISLNELAADNLDRTESRYGHFIDSSPEVVVFDEAFPVGERLPRHLVIRFEEGRREADDRPQVSMYLEHADPWPYADSPTERQIEVIDKLHSGLPLHAAIGDPLTDNASIPDDYRYHDAFHLGFLAVLGWSPVLRSLLRLKRKSDPVVDESQDGARAVDVEEGLTSYLRQVARDRSDFRTPAHVDNEVLDHVEAHTRGLEVQSLPMWMWRQAISQGFQCWRQLVDNRGGYALLDLDSRTLAYRKTWKT